MQQYYLHNEFINNGLRQNVKPVKVNNHQILCMTNDNIIEFYQYTENGIRYQSKHSINCNIAKLQILPTKPMHKDDYLFIVDKKGRYGIWRADSGFQTIQNSPAQTQFSLYKNEDQVDQVSFSGQMHHFDVFDTKGSVFFTFKHKIFIIDYTITRMGIHIQRTINISIPYVQYRYTNWIRSSKKAKFLGIIEQIQEKTILKIHNIETSSKITAQNKIFEREKVNLTDFISENDELLLVSDDEITGISLKSHTQLFSHNFHNYNGKVIKLDVQTYCFIGQEMLVFNNQKIISYGSFREEGVNIFQKKGVLQARCLKITEDNGFMVTVSTFNNQIYFLVLYENQWKLYYHLKALTSIYSIHPTANPNSIVTVMDQSIDQYQVVFVEKQALTPLIKQQRCQITIDKLLSIEQGQLMAVLSQQTNILMKYNQIGSQFEFVKQLPKGNILLISNNIMITESALYTVSLEDSFHEQLVRQDIILTAYNRNRVIYMNGEGVVKMITTEPLDITILRNNAFDEYAWHLLQNNDLLVAKTSNPLSIYVYHRDNTIYEIGLVENCLISSIHHFTYENQTIVEETIVIGYMNGSIHLYSMGGQIKAKLNAHSNEPVSFYNINNQLLGIACGSKQFILSYKNAIFSIKTIQFSKNDNIITSVTFLETVNKFIFVENKTSESGKLIRMISLSDVYDGLNIATNNHDSYRIRTISHGLKQIPTVFLYKQYILLGVNSHLLVYHVQSGRLVKDLHNYIQDVLGVAVLEYGLIIYGIDSIKRNLLYVYSHELEEQFFINFIMKDNKYIKNIKQLPYSNRFLCRGETFTTLCELNHSKEIIQILQFKTDLLGYSLEIDADSCFLAETDSKRLLIVLSYADSMLPIARYVNTSEINDFLMLHRCVIIGDKAGYLHLLQFNTEDPNEALRMAITKVASIHVGQQVTTLSKKSSTQAFYGTVSGRIGSVHLISEQYFKILKPSEEASLRELKRGRDFEYTEWRGRNINEDKLIDGTLIKQYLHYKSKKILNETEKSSFEEAHALFGKLII